MTNSLSDHATYSNRAHLSDLSLSVASGRVMCHGVINHEGISKYPNLMQKAVIRGGAYSILRAENTSNGVTMRQIIEDAPSGVIKHVMWAAHNSLEMEY